MISIKQVLCIGIIQVYLKVEKWKWVKYVVVNGNTYL